MNTWLCDAPGGVVGARPHFLAFCSVICASMADFSYGPNGYQVPIDGGVERPPFRL
jgi:hypothetical protein